MYRGSSFLLQRDYKIHRKCVKKILKKKYNKLRHITLADYKGENSAKNMKLLFCLVKEIVGDQKIKGCYEQKPSDTLVTKILLGTLGCVPAYDDLFKSQLKKETTLISRNKKIPASFSEKSFKKFIDECDAREEIFKDFKKNVKICKSYPDMKIIDMYFWGKYFIESDMHKKNKEKYLK